MQNSSAASRNTTSALFLQKIVFTRNSIVHKRPFHPLVRLLVHGHESKNGKMSISNGFLRVWGKWGGVWPPMPTRPQSHNSASYVILLSVSSSLPTDESDRRFISPKCKSELGFQSHLVAFGQTRPDIGYTATAVTCG